MAGGNPFRGFTWATTWWRHYGAGTGATGRKSGLYVVAVFDEAQRLQGVLPLYRRYSLTRGWVLQWLGSGEVCPEYLGTLCKDESAEAVTQALADWLCDPSRTNSQRWDLLRLDSVNAQDQVTARLVEALDEHRCHTHSRHGPRCSRVELPAEWEEYVQRLSKAHRKQVRRFERNLLESGRAVLHSAETAADLQQAFPILVDLHQRRRTALGEPGCFASPRFAAFHGEVSTLLAQRGQCSVQWVEIDGQPAAAEYSFLGGGLCYVYQAGINPDLPEEHPGSLMTTALLKQAIEGGYRGVDFLRGDEPYKAHFRAEPRPNVEFFVAAPRGGRNVVSRAGPRRTR